MAKTKPDALATASKLVDAWIAKAALVGHSFRSVMALRGELVMAIVRAIERKET